MYEARFVLLKTILLFKNKQKLFSLKRYRLHCKSKLLNKTNKKVNRKRALKTYYNYFLRKL